MVMLRVFFVTHIGSKDNQEDCLLVNGRVILEADRSDPVVEAINGNEGLFVVCDGVGGHEGGEWASRFVCEQLATRLSPAAAGPDDVSAALAETQRAIELARGGEAGTTVAGLIVANGRTVAFNDGDSRVYRLADDGIDLLSRDHSLLQSLLDEGRLGPEEARNFPYRNVIEFGLGEPFSDSWRNADSTVHIAEHAVAPGNAYLVCSDGVTDTVEDREIHAVLWPPSRDNAAALARRLVNEARDNFAFILVATA